MGLRESKKAKTRQAIADAALALFAERGFEAVTVAEVAVAAEVAERTLFRYFGDKEELLFGQADAVRGTIEAALAARPAAEPPAVAVREALRALTPALQSRQAAARVRQKVIDASPRLVARERAKLAGYERVLADGLVARGADPAVARLLGRAAMACAQESLVRWFADADPQRPGLAERGRAAFAELAAELARVS